MAVVLLPTPEQIASWPKPNYIDPQSRKAILIGVEGTVTALAIIFVGARFYARTQVRRVLGWDDWSMLAALTLVVAFTTLQCLGTLYNGGLHLWDIRYDWIIPTGKITYATQVIFAPASALAKISMCLTYLRVFPSGADRRFASFGIAFSVVYCIAITFLHAFQCFPVGAYWAPWLHSNARCISADGLAITTQALNSISDLLIFLWPARTLRKVRVGRAQRFGLIFVFSVGVSVCTVGVVRIYFLVVYFRSYDIYWNGTILCILAATELSLGVVCGSLPGCKPLLGRLFPCVFGSVIMSSAPSWPGQLLPGARVSILPVDLEKNELHPSTTTATSASIVEVPVKLDTGQVVGIQMPNLEVAPTLGTRATSPAVPSPAFLPHARLCLDMGDDSRGSSLLYGKKNDT